MQKTIIENKKIMGDQFKLIATFLSVLTEYKGLSDEELKLKFTELAKIKYL